MILTKPLFGSWAGKAQYLIAELVILGGGWLYVIWRRMPVRAAMRWNLLPMSVWAPIMLIAGSAAILLDAFDRLIGVFIPIPVEQLEALRRMAQFDTPLNAIWICLGLGVAAPLTEESLFRGLVQQILEKHRGAAGGVFWSALLFALIHLEYWWLIQILVLSILAGYLAWRWNSILPAVAIHSSNNLWSVIIIQDRAVELRNFYLWNNFVSPVWIIVMLIVFISGCLWCQNQWRQLNQM
ncbi:MAG: CPBP family intramembrane metalloprotease [Calditrichaeota bacterium]|nr:CPBP family intramembrane metalloprotease [Calditrichota bacterium]